MTASSSNIVKASLPAGLPADDVFALDENLMTAR